MPIAIGDRHNQATFGGGAIASRSEIGHETVELDVRRSQFLENRLVKHPTDTAGQTQVNTRASPKQKHEINARAPARGVVAFLPTIGLALLALTASARGQCQYQVETWPQWTCEWGTHRSYSASGLNNLGGWCGHRSMCFPEEGEGFLPIYCPPGGQPQILPLPASAGPWGAKATGTNDTGATTGYFSLGGDSTPSIGCIWWPDGSLVTIGPISGASASPAFAINAKGLVVGQNGNTPYVWFGGEMKLIDPSPLPNGYAVDVSDNGWVTGSGGDIFGTDGRAFRWMDGSIEVLEPLSGSQTSEARGVNASGVVVGMSRRWDSKLGYMAAPTRWSSDGVHLLPLPPGYQQGGAVSINDSGVIVGIASPDPGSGLPTVRVAWIEGTVFVLNDLVEPGSPAMGTPIAIAESGRILTAGPKVLIPSASSQADLTGDCAVDGADVAVVLADWGPRAWSIADLNGDSVVNGYDLAAVLGEWTPAPSDR